LDKIDFKILKATQDDLKTILELQKECYQTEATLYNDFNIPPLTQNLESIHEEIRQETLFLKGIFDGKIIASVRGYIKNDTAYIGRLIVKSEFQNKKIGKALMSRIESELENCNRYELFTGFKSEKNLNLYKKLGYKEFKQQIVNENLTLIHLEKRVRNDGKL
jgi:N-acetylglutamate synthase-like GNAT family acetyltransferase